MDGMRRSIRKQNRFDKMQKKWLKNNKSDGKWQIADGK